MDSPQVRVGVFGLDMAWKKSPALENITEGPEIDQVDFTD